MNKPPVMCISAKDLFGKGKWNGLKTDNLDYYYNLIKEKHVFLPRNDELESNSEYKQVIPQVILRYKDKETYKYFMHRRKGGNESRLNEKWPIPIGGHSEEFDQGEDKIQTALERELYEEVNLNSNIKNRKFLGIIYIEDENPVNHVHIGFVYIFDLDGTNVSIKETDVLEEIGFVDINFIKQNLDKLDYWSKVISEYLE